MSLVELASDLLRLLLSREYADAQFCIFLCHSTGQVATVLDIWVDGYFVFNKMSGIYCSSIIEQANESGY